MKNSFTPNPFVNDGKSLPVMEEFYSLQGEGYHTGKAAYFIRIGGCDVGCNWCDVKESWNADIHPLVSVEKVLENVLASKADTVVVTGGEPLNYNLDFLCSVLQRNKIKTFLETSGTQPVSGNWDWICLSPKKNTEILEDFYNKADELKVIIQNSDDFLWAEKNAAMMKKDTHLFLQPEWSSRRKMIPVIVEHILKDPKWSVSLQSHKYMNIP